jgi:hypothetical protein
MKLTPKHHHHNDGEAELFEKLKKEKEEILKASSRANTTEELTYLVGEKVNIKMDIYNITIAANLTKNVTSQELNISLKYCFIVFIIQIYLAYSFSQEYTHLSNFQPYVISKTILRLIMTLFYQKTVLKDMANNMKMLTFLKRMKQAKKHSKGRLINIAISSMQFISTFATYACLLINMG